MVICREGVTLSGGDIGPGAVTTSGSGVGVSWLFSGDCAACASLVKIESAGAAAGREGCGSSSIDSVGAPVVMGSGGVSIAAGVATRR